MRRRVMMKPQPYLTVTPTSQQYVTTSTGVTYTVNTNVSWEAK